MILVPPIEVFTTGITSTNSPSNVLQTTNNKHDLNTYVHKNWRKKKRDLIIIHKINEKKISAAWEPVEVL